MEGGDISNTVVTGRTLVNARTFTHPRIDLERRWFGLITLAHRSLDIDVVRLSAIVRASYHLPALTLVTTDDSWDWDAVWDVLEDQYDHPFKSMLSYESDQHLAQRLAWMPNTRVVDLPEKAAVYGSRYVDIPW